MAITQISQLQVRRGLNQDLPQLAAGELGWSTDTLQLYIGNGSINAPDYAPVEGQTQILTQYSILNFTNSLNGNISALQSNVTILQGNIVTLTAAISGAGLNTTVVSLNSGTQNSVAGITANNATITYTLNENGAQRTGVVHISRPVGSATVSYDEEYSQTATTQTTLSISGNTSYSTLWANTSTYPSTLSYRISSI
jgi:hypothetical protein